MDSITTVRTIAAPISKVFATVADVREFTAALPHATGCEFLTEKTSGVGTRFNQTRLMGKKEHTTELEITEYVPDDRVRLVAESGGAVWDSLFTVEPDGDGTRLTVTMEARTDKVLPKFMYKLVKGMVTKAFEKDIDLVKAYCER